MNSPPGRFSQLRWVQNLTCLAGLIGGALIMGLGVLGYGNSPRAWLLAAGGLLVFLAALAMTFIPLLVKMESTLARQLGELRDLNELIAKHMATLEAVAENTRLSDAAKSLARREQEIEALREAIREDIRSERWDAGLNLIDEIERRFGYKEEAERIREELDNARNDRIQKTLMEAIEMIETHFHSRQWDRAQNEIERLMRALPEDPRVLGLPDRLRSLRDAHKEELRVAWDDAVRRSDTDHAIEILKELDQYLSPAEGQQLQASARNVFKEKLLQLGVQFRFAVTEKRWADALTTGLELVREFPNARMANEVREVLDTLRERARQNESQDIATVKS